jgi:hypothetical protein
MLTSNSQIAARMILEGLKPAALASADRYVREWVYVILGEIATYAESFDCSKETARRDVCEAYLAPDEETEQ